MLNAYVLTYDTLAKIIASIFVEVIITLIKNGIRIFVATCESDCQSAYMHHICTINVIISIDNDLNNLDITLELLWSDVK